MTLDLHFRRAGCPWLLLTALAISPSALGTSWKEQVLYSFQGGSDGEMPAGGVVFDKSGNLYGTTVGGGADNCAPIAACGTVFELSPPAKKGDPWTETVLYVFKGKVYNDGDTPGGGLVLDAAGNLYGATEYGGAGDCVLLGTKAGCGTVFEMSPPLQKGGAWTETILYSFQSGNDGYAPLGNLTFDKSGNLYGATYFGGGKGNTCNPYFQYCGTVFKMSPPKQKGGAWAEKVLHSFAGGTDGADPNGGLVLDSKGAIYGTTFYGGNENGECNGGSGGTGCGTVFKLTSPTRKGGAWTEGILNRFSGQDGATPAAGVILGKDGDLYGTAFAGGNHGNGGIFELTKPAGKSRTWTEKVLYLFNGGNDGDNPMAGLIFGVNGDLYGTAYAGQSVSGTVFDLTTDKRKGTWTYGVLYGFGGPPDGALPAASLVSDGAGNLYSTTQNGGTGTACGFGCGTVFEVSP